MFLSGNLVAKANTSAVSHAAGRLTYMLPLYHGSDPAFISPAVSFPVTIPHPERERIGSV